MNIPNQQRWRSLIRGRQLARYIHLKSRLDFSCGLSLSRYCQPFSKTSQHCRFCIICSILRDVPLHPHCDFQTFYSAILWRIIAQYTRIAGDTS